MPWAIAVPLGFVAALWAVEQPRALRAHAGRRRHLAQALDSIYVLKRLFVQPKHLLGPLGTALYWFGDIVCLWACLQAFTHGTPDISLLLLGYATGYALTRRTLPFGGAGAVEALLPFALSWCGISLAAAVLAVFAYRVFNFWLPIVPAALGLRSMRAAAARLDDARPRAASRRASSTSRARCARRRGRRAAASPRKLTVVLRRVRPRRTAGSVRLGPSTSTSSTRPTRSAFRSAAMPLHELDEPLDAVALDLVRDLLGHRRRVGARARRVDERERAVEADLLDDLERLAEVVLGLAGEADDDVGREREIGDAGAHLVDELQVALARVRAAHRLEDARRAGLQRQVRVLAHRGALGHRLDHRARGSPSGAGS